MGNSVYKRTLTLLVSGLLLASCEPSVQREPVPSPTLRPENVEAYCRLVFNLKSHDKMLQNESSLTSKAAYIGVPSEITEANRVYFSGHEAKDAATKEKHYVAILTACREKGRWIQ
jgi:hypothetical protein